MDAGAGTDSAAPGVGSVRARGAGHGHLLSDTTWSVVGSGDAASGQVSAAGLFTAGGADGTLYVQALYHPTGSGQLSDTATLTISGNAVVSLTLSPSSVSLHPASYQTFAATATFDGGSTQDVTLEASWSSDAPDVAQAPCDGVPGRACALDAGTADVVATFRSLTATAPVTVLEASAVTSLSVSPSRRTCPRDLGPAPSSQPRRPSPMGPPGPCLPIGRAQATRWTPA